MEILYQYIKTTYTWGWNPLCWLIFAVLLGWISIVIIDRVCLKKAYSAETKSFAWLIAIGLIASNLLAFRLGQPVPYDVYKVTIDENTINYTEFLDQYEILEQEGKIYTIRERDNG